MIGRLFLGLVAITFIHACSTTSAPEPISAIIVEDIAKIDCSSYDEFYPAQARVTELYISNLRQRLARLEDEAKCCRPYNPDPNAPMIDESLIQDILRSRETIKRHQAKLDKFQSDCPGQLQNPDDLLIADSSRRPDSQ